jgi:hypothetical protein
MSASGSREARNLCYFRSPYSVGFEPTMFFTGTQELLDVKVRALQCFGSQQQSTGTSFGNWPRWHTASTFING